MKNAVFDIALDQATGFITSIVCKKDLEKMNWCASDGFWGQLHTRFDPLNECSGDGHWGLHTGSMKLGSFIQNDNISTAVYSNDRLCVTVTRSFNAKGNFVESYLLKNITETVLCVNRDNFGIETSWNDRYTFADECMARHCNTHIWCGHHVAWVDALKMGPSENNMGLVLKKGAIDCYTQEKVKSNNRGVFIMNPESMFLKSGETYLLEWELFTHKGKEDFAAYLSNFDRYISINATHFTVFGNEPIEFKINTASNNVPEVTCRSQKVPVIISSQGYSVTWQPPVPGEYRFDIKCGNISTYADFMARPEFKTILEKRVHFIIDHQQCLDPDSPLYGAFLVYDNEYDSPYFDFWSGDHNASQERLNISLMLIKYLQCHNDPKVRTAIDLFIKFVFREFYDEETGAVYNNIGKMSERIRLYNAPGVMLLFAEMYFLTRERMYLDNIVKLAKNYYGIGGKKCYANGLSISKVIRAFKMEGMDEELNIMMEFFHSHVDNIIGNGLSYPKHEVNYEQTIVTPAVTHISEMGALCEDREHFITEAKKHLACLERFSGHQPDFHLNEIAIRFWDGFWFGKIRLMGDTLPHHLSVLSARGYLAYSRLTGDSTYAAKAEECLRNCMCLINDEGRGSAAYLYPYRINDRRAGFFDPWSNDQDLVLYDAMYAADKIELFRV